MQVSKDKIFLFSGILMILLGAVMLISPTTFTELFSIVIGIAVILEGFITLFAVVPEFEDEVLRRNLKIRGILGILVGLLAVFLPLFMAGTVWIIMLYILGAEMLVSAWLEFLVVRKLRETGVPVRDFVIEIVLLVVLALLLFIFPFQIGLLFIRIVGIVVIIGGGVGLYRWKTYAA